MSKSGLQQKSNKLTKKLPAYFIPNVGQLKDKTIYYYAKSSQCRAAFTSEGVYFTFLKIPSREVGKPNPLGDGVNPLLEVEGFEMCFRFHHSRKEVKPEGMAELPGRINHFKGNDPNNWHTNISSFEKVVYSDLWPGIDLIFRGDKGQLKYEFVVHPGANLENIQFSYEGSENLVLDNEGNLRIKTSFGEMWDERPISYQERGPQPLPIESSFQIVQNQEGQSIISFKISEDYDPFVPLVIDPGLIFSSYLGGSSEDYGTAIALDPSGNAYLTGYTASPDFPVRNAFQSTFKGVYDVFLTKVDSTGALLFSTYLGGSQVDSGLGVAVDDLGNAYLTGYTSSVDFPTTPDAIQLHKNGSTVKIDAFISKLNTLGTLVYSTYFGGSDNDYGQSIAIDNEGNVYLTGVTSSADFPTKYAFQSTYGGGLYDAFITRINLPNYLVYSTFLGGNDLDYGYGIAVDKDRNAYVAGETLSVNFPTQNAIQSTLRGNSDASITKVGQFGTLIYSTYLGGSGNDSAYSIKVDDAGNVYFTGSSSSSDYPTTPNAFQPNFKGYDDVIVTKIDSTGTHLVYSTYLGGRDYDAGFSIAIDPAGNAYVTGETSSYDFPTTPDALPPIFASGFDIDAFVTKINPTGTGILYSTFLGGSGYDFGSGIAVDGNGNIYVTGTTYSANFPTQNAFQPNFGGVFDAFVTKIGATAAAANPLEGPIASMEQALANTLNVVSATGDVTAIQRILKLIIKKEILLEFLIEESKNLQ